MAHECSVAEVDGEIAGFLVSRQLAPDESEILNLAVAPAHRRQGVGRSLLSDVLARRPAAVLLEVRESNTVARRFYEEAGFRIITKRLQYYSNPVEAAIVMKLHS